MELNRKTRELLGTSLFLSSITLSTTAAALCAGRRVGAGMLATLAALECGIGAMLVCSTDQQIREKIEKKRAAAVQRAAHVEIPCNEEGYEELFTEEDCARVEATVRDELNRTKGEHTVAVREIPRDEEATEEEFQ